MDAGSRRRPRPGRVGLLAVAALATVALVAGPLGVEPVARPDQATTVDLLSPTARAHPAPALAPPQLRWTYQPDGELLGSDLNLERLYLLQRRLERLELVSIDLDTGREAWRRTLGSPARAEVEADTGQVLVTTAGSTRLGRGTGANSATPGAGGSAEAPEGADQDTQTPQGSTPGSTAPGAGTPESGASDSGTAESTTPESTTPESTTPEAGTPEAGSPQAGTPGAGGPAPGSGTAESGTPESPTPGAPTPESATPESATPGSATPGAATPAPGAGTPPSSTPDPGSGTPPSSSPNPGAGAGSGSEPAGSDPEPGSAGSAAEVEEGHRVTAYDEKTSNERWTVGVRAGETHASVGRFMVVAPRYDEDGTVRPGTIRVFERQEGRTAWTRTSSATVDAFREDLVVADGAGTAVLALPSGAEWDRFATTGGVPPRLVGAHELALPTQGGLLYTARGGSSTSFVKVEGLEPTSLQPVGDHMTLLDGGQGTMSVDRRTLEVVPLVPPDAEERHAIGHGDEVRLLFGWEGRLVSVAADGSDPRERRFPEGDETVAGFAGWLVYMCEGTQRVAAYDLRTMHGIWRVPSTERPEGTCDIAPVPGGFLAVDQDLRILSYRS